MINLTTNDKYETLGQIKTVTPIAEGYECMLADMSRILTKNICIIFNTISSLMI